MRADLGEGVPESATFAQRLDTLKREGSNILVVGAAETGAHVEASRRLLGEGDATRRRLFVFTEHTAVVRSRVPEEDLPDERARIVTRTASDPAEATTHPHVDESVVGDGLLSDLGNEIMAAIDEFEAAGGGGGLEAAELRLCFDSLSPLLTDNKSETVFRLLHMVTSRVRQVSGMGHYHLRVDRDSDYVHLLEPLFDAVVEVRSVDGRTEQRWHLREDGVTSDWLPL